MTNFYNAVLDIKQDDPGAKNENLNNLGYGSMFFIYNMGTLLISIAVIPLLAILSYILGLMKEQSSLANRQYLNISRLLYWDYILGTFFESYSVICMCVAINLTYVSKHFFLTLL